MKKLIQIIAIAASQLVFTDAFSQTWQYYDSLRLVHQNNQEYEVALTNAEKALQIVKETFGENDTLYATSCNNVAELYSNLGEYSFAEPLFLEAKKIRKEVLGEKHPSYAVAINNLAALYYAMGKYSAAEFLMVEAKNILKEALGEKHPDYARSLNNLATLYWVIGNYTAAEPLYLEAKNIRKEMLGEMHPDYAISLFSLAYLYFDLGNFHLAEPLFIEAKNIWKEMLGEKHPHYAAALNSLAELYYVMGNYPAAEPLYLETMNIRKEVMGDMHPDYATSLNNLAALYWAMGNYSAAEPLYLESMKIWKEVLGEKHPDYATSLNNLALLYKSMGNYLAAETFYLESKGISKEALGEKHPLYAIFLNNFAELYKVMGNYAAAEPLMLEAKNILKEVFGVKHPDYANSLNSLAGLNEAIGNYPASQSFYLECLEVLNGNIIQNFSFLSEKEKEMYFISQASIFENFYSFSLKRKAEDGGITRTVYNNVVKNKGLLLKSSTAMRMSILSSNDTTLIAKYEKWIAIKKEISILYSSEISKRKKDPAELEQECNSIEKDLVRESQIFGEFEKLQSITWESVRNNLKPEDAAIEFIHFAQTGKKDSVLYAALIIKPDSKYPEMVPLFYEKDLVAMLGSNTENNLRYINSIYGGNNDPNVHLYNLIWKPMEPFLNGVKSVYLSPSGLLHKVSFAAIAKEQYVFLCDLYDLNVQTSTAKVALPTHLKLSSELTASIFGVINYNTENTEEEVWNYLEGTKQEAEIIKNLLSKKKVKTKLFVGNESTEEAMKLNNSNVIHIATHGFFYPDPKEQQLTASKKVEVGEVFFRGGRGTRGFGVWSFVRNPNPLMRSGLTFAGANRVWSDQYVNSDIDGVLTAEEVISIDMRNTELVVLSACETGLGDIKGSEGVYGLQRAFKMAGAKFIVMSLWQVPDKETVEFMETFYTKLLKQKDIRKSFSETQKEMRKKYDPYYWAAFVLVE